MVSVDIKRHVYFLPFVCLGVVLEHQQSFLFQIFVSMCYTMHWFVPFLLRVNAELPLQKTEGGTFLASSSHSPQIGLYVLYIMCVQMTEGLHILKINVCVILWSVILYHLSLAVLICCEKVPRRSNWVH